MARLRYNGLSTTLGASLTSSDTAVTFGAALTHSGGTAVPTIGAGDYIPLTILDATGKLSEIVYLTAYTSGATTGTIARAKEGTTGVAHSSGDKVTHGPTVLDMTAFGNPAIEGTSLIPIGHSYVATPGPACSPGAEWVNRVYKRFAMNLFNFGQSSARLHENLTAMWASAPTGHGITSHIWTPGAKALAVIDSVLNDGQAGTASTQAVGGYKHALRSMLALISSATRIEQTAATTTGTWGAATPDGNSSISWRSTTSQGATMSYAVSGYTTYYVAFLVGDPAGLPTGVATYAVDDIVQATVDGTQAANQLSVYGGVSGTPQTYFWGVVKLTTADTGSHVLKITKTDASTSAVVYSDCVLPQQPAPPPVIVMKDPLLKSAYANAATWAANRPTYNTAIDSVVAEFPNAQTLDLNSGWDPATMIGSDNAHPNDLGMARIADQVSALLAAFPFSAGLNKL